MTTSPLVVAYGAGVDSTAMIIGLVERNVQIDAIVFADTGAEKPETYEYLAIMDEWLARNNQPQITVVTRPGYVNMQVPDLTLEDELLRLETLPSWTFGRHSCSAKWKIDPQNNWAKQWAPAQEAWAAGLPVIRAIGFDCSPQDSKRKDKTLAYNDECFEAWMPLHDWGWDRVACEAAIITAGLPVPVKSACYFCPSAGWDEVEDLAERHPDLFATAIQIEQQALVAVHKSGDKAGQKKIQSERIEGIKMGNHGSWAAHMGLITIEAPQMDFFAEAAG